jgi:hypothetical protein
MIGSLILVLVIVLLITGNQRVTQPCPQLMYYSTRQYFHNSVRNRRFKVHFPANSSGAINLISRAISFFKQFHFNEPEEREIFAERRITRPLNVRTFPSIVFSFSLKTNEISAVTFLLRQGSEHSKNYWPFFTVDTCPVRVLPIRSHGAPLFGDLNFIFSKCFQTAHFEFVDCGRQVRSPVNKEKLSRFH